jgi:hypothetical protein
MLVLSNNNTSPFLSFPQTSFPLPYSLERDAVAGSLIFMWRVQITIVTIFGVARKTGLEYRGERWHVAFIVAFLL